jgi:hypothetical protein
MTEPLANQRDINAKIASCVPSHAWNSTVAIVIAHNDAVHQFGTGMLFRIADKSFLITAGHVAQKAAANKKTLGISGSDDGTFISLAGEFMVSSEGQYGCDEDPFDIAILALPKDSIFRMQKKTFLLLNDVDFDEQSATGVYAIFGFPSVWSESCSDAGDTLKTKALEFIAFRSDRDTAALENYQERLHLLLDASPDYLTTQDGTNAQFLRRDGTEASFPGELGGISGCGVWRIGDLKVPINDWCRSEPRIAAVQTAVYPKRGLIRATRWAAVSTLIYEAFPELRPSLAIYRRR